MIFGKNLEEISCGIPVGIIIVNSEEIPVTFLEPLHNSEGIFNAFLEYKQM